MLETQYLVVGDLHRQWNKLQIIINGVYHKLYKGIILVGDIGLEFDQDIENLKKLHIPKEIEIYAIHGNHDKPDFWHKAEVHIDRFHFIQNGQIIELAGENVLFYGGANSPDVLSRVEGFNWFANEVPSQKECNDFLELLQQQQPHIDVVITHECPGFVPIHDHLGFRKDDPQLFYMCRFLQEVYDILEHKPRRWFFGHYHTSWIWSNGTTEFVCKDLVKTPIKRAE